jgi:hypothetical protein
VTMPWWSRLDPPNENLQFSNRHSCAVPRCQGFESHHRDSAAHAPALSVPPSHYVYRSYSSAPIPRCSGENQTPAFLLHTPPKPNLMQLSVWMRCILVAHAALLVSMPDVSKLLQVH